MEKLLSVNDIMERYQCSRQTAIRYIRQMEHQTRPYMVTERAVAAWDKSRTVVPAEVIRRQMMINKMRRANK